MMLAVLLAAAATPTLVTPAQKTAAQAIRAEAMRADIRFLSSLDTPVKEGDEISIVPAIAGGAA